MTTFLANDTGNFSAVGICVQTVGSSFDYSDLVSYFYGELSGFVVDGEMFEKCFEICQTPFGNKEMMTFHLMCGRDENRLISVSVTEDPNVAHFCASVSGLVVFVHHGFLEVVECLIQRDNMKSTKNHNSVHSFYLKKRIC